MKKMNKKLALALLTLGITSLTPAAASADSCAPRDCNPCNTPCKTDCCSFDVGVDVLYWKPCVDDLDFSATVAGEVANVDNPLEVRYNSVCPEWEPGFRIILKKENAWKNFDLSLSYTWLNSDDSESSTADNGERIAAVNLHPFLVDDLGANSNFFDFARGKWELNYQTFDILLSHPFHCGSCHTISPFFGVEIVKLDQEWDVKYEYSPANSATSGVGLVDWESDYRGAGLKLGTDYNYLLCDGLSLFARASGTIAVGDATTHNKQALYFVDSNGVIQSTPVDYVDFKDDDCCHVVPGYHLQLGLQYEDNTCGCEYKLRLGYEMVQWYNLQNPRRWFEADDGGNIAQSTQSNTTTLGFHGLLAGFEVKF